MQSLPLLDAIQAPLPIYRHCTLQEILFLGCCVLGISLLLFPIMTLLLFASAWLGFAIALPLSFVLTRFAIGKLGRLKQGKPRGFCQQRARKRLAALGLYRSPCVERVGRWSIGRQ